MAVLRLVKIFLFFKTCCSACKAALHFLRGLRFCLLGVLLSPVFLPNTLFAAQPAAWQLGFQEAASEVMADIVAFNTLTLWIITAVVVFVLVLLLTCVIRYRAKVNPVPSTRTHHVGIEVIWTVVPVFILLVIAIPSFRLLYKQLEIPPASLTVKATGYQWYWGYAYPDEGFEDLSFESLMLTDAERQEKMVALQLSEEAVPRLLATDNPLVVPVGEVVRLQVTAADVIHSFALPAFGIKTDAIPGQLNETWFNVQKPGVYYGQCSELCGMDHAFMPIEIYAIPPENFSEWIQLAKKDLQAAQNYARLHTGINSSFPKAPRDNSSPTEGEENGERSSSSVVPSRLDSLPSDSSPEEEI